jgi:AcrR family transcriptional regulator
MPRWEGDAAGRLERAALELFDERGFERTTVAEIARRAGLTERSFYRYFADKREALFGGGDELERHLTQALDETPADVGPLDALLAAIASAEKVFRPRELLLIRQRIINANPALRERELIKMETIYASLASGLRARGEDEMTARLSTDMAISVWRVAAGCRMSGDETSFAVAVHDTAERLRRIAGS